MSKPRSNTLGNRGACASAIRGAGSKWFEALESRSYLSAIQVTDLNLRTNGSNPTPMVRMGDDVFVIVQNDGQSVGQSIWRTRGTAATMSRVFDPNGGGPPAKLTVMGGNLYFQSDRTLYRTDGTMAGNTALKTFKTLPTTSLYPYAATPSAVFFSAAEDSPSVADQELWMTTGTAAGTVVVKNINPTASSAPQLLTAIGSTVFFTADNGTNGRELWKSDGTEAGTTLVKDIRSGSASSSPTEFVVFGGVLYFVANDGINGSHLWRSDGTDAGTYPVTLGVTGFSGTAPTLLTPAGNTLYFTDASKAQLWKTEGTYASTIQVASIPTASLMTARGNDVFFFGGGTATPGLWRSDGTPAGTERLMSSGTLRSIREFNGKVLFQANTPAEGDELWISDGTVAGTRLLLDIQPGVANSDAKEFFTYGDKALFSAYTDLGGELWSTDGTTAGTQLVVDLNTQGYGTSPQYLTKFRGHAFFTATPSYKVNGLYRTDGTPQNVVELATVTTPESKTSNTVFESLTVAGSRLFFVRYDPYVGKYLCVTDGTKEGIVELGLFNTLGDMVVMNDVLYFSAWKDSTAKQELYRSDGTIAGTTLAADIWVGDSSRPDMLTVVGNTLFFYAEVAGDRELWKSDGTAAGTMLVKNINPTGSSGIWDAETSTTLDGVLYFSTSDGTGWRSFWRSDGTAAGTYALKSFGEYVGSMYVPNGPSRKQAMTSIASGSARGVYFHGYFNSYALYRYDGTSTAIAQSFSDSSGNPPYGLSAAGGKVYSSTTGTGGYNYRDLWVYDGTGPGSLRIKRFAINNPSSDPWIGALVPADDGKVYFTAQDFADNAGNELWRTDGTAAGTVRVTDIQPGAGSSINYYTSTRLNDPVAIDGRLLFPAASLTVGGELFAFTTGVNAAIPAGPTALNATAFNGVRINLAWQDNAVGEIGYRLERSLSPTFATLDATHYLLADTVSFADLGLLENTTYHYRLVAYTSGGDSTVATTSTTTPNTPRSPSAFTAVAATGVDAGRRVDLTWADNASNETGYRLERSLSATFATIDQTFNLPANTSAYADTTVNPLTTYHYRLVAVNAVGDSALAAMTTVATPIAQPSAPTGFVAWAISDSAARLQWDDTPTETGYLIERSTVGGAFEQIASTAANILNYTDSSLLAGLNYQYRIRATNASGAGSYSATQTTTALPPQLTSLVKDIHDVQIAAGSGPSKPVVVNGIAYFTATNQTHGRELWRTDGTAAGTFMVADLNPGSTGSNPTQYVVSGNQFYFWANGGTGKNGIWISDGTAAGTRFVKAMAASTTPPTAAGGNLYFVVNDNLYGMELWKSDGTAAGTVMVRDIQPGVSGSGINYLTAMGNRVYFRASTTFSGVELWQSDGTAAGTFEVRDSHPANNQGSIANLVVMNGILYYAGSDNVAGTELWRSDGTAAGTWRLTDINPGTSSAIIRNIVAADGVVYFSADDPDGPDLWKTDGTVAGTVKVMELPTHYWAEPWQLTSVGNTAYFLLRDATTSERLLYRTDGTAAGTNLVQTLPSSGANAPRELTASNGLLYYIRADNSALWRTDGTLAGTIEVLPGSAAASGLAHYNGTLLLSAAAGSTGVELYSTTGTPASVTQVAEIAPQTGSSAPSHLLRVGNTVYFSATNSAGVRGLYRTDGTAGNTLRIADGDVRGIVAGPDGSVYFMTFTTGVARLFKTSGVAGDAIDLSGAISATYTGNLLATASAVYFVARNADATGRLVRSDGTVAGTSEVPGILVAVDDSPTFYPQPVAMGDHVYLAAVGADGVELWRTDGSVGGTGIVADLSPGAAGSTPHNLTVIGSTLYFVATDPTNGWALRKTDGTAAGTSVVRAFVERPIMMSAVGSRVFFTVSEGGTGLELWVSDGTAAGTTQVADLNPGSAWSSPTSITDVGGTAYFRATDARGAGLWRSDGTAAGTVRIFDMAASGQWQIINANGVAYFTDNSHLWKTNGQTTGTVRQMQIGPSVGFPIAVATDDRLIFTANAASLGPELWQLSLGASPAAPGNAMSAPRPSGGTTVSWSDLSAIETGFLVERLAPPSFGDPQVERTYFVGSNITQLIDPLGGNAQYRISAYNAAGASGTVIANPAVAPTILSWKSAGVHGRGVGEVTLTVPDDGSFVEPRLSGVSTLLITFDSPINPASLSPAGIGIWGNDVNGSPIDLSGITVGVGTRAGDTIAVVTFSQKLPDYARYLVRISGVTGANGLALGGDTDRVLTALLGDATGDRRVNNTDVGAVTSMRGIDPINPAVVNEIRSDVTNDGRVNNTDVGGITSVRGKDARNIPDPAPPVGGGGVAPAAVPSSFVVTAVTPKQIDPLSARWQAPLSEAAAIVNLL